ncbi:hypothetical protein ACRALDRAFT_1061557 [Sodiomyces alcalophilus JCM 7366]|uniref:uncharacterized protein n=1 Tax=Sodiomyces alcalophilus JCM 7366 TaxID=591952 RepID=UPI0039B510F6
MPDQAALGGIRGTYSQEGMTLSADNAGQRKIQRQMPGDIRVSLSYRIRPSQVRSKATVGRYLKESVWS